MDFLVSALAPLVPKVAMRDSAPAPLVVEKKTVVEVVTKAVPVGPPAVKPPLLKNKLPYDNMTY